MAPVPTYQMVILLLYNAADAHTFGTPLFTHLWIGPSELQCLPTGSYVRGGGGGSIFSRMGRMGGWGGEGLETPSHPSPSYPSQYTVPTPVPLLSLICGPHNRNCPYEEVIGR